MDCHTQGFLQVVRADPNTAKHLTRNGKLVRSQKLHVSRGVVFFDLEAKIERGSTDKHVFKKRSLVTVITKALSVDHIWSQFIAFHVLKTQPSPLGLGLPSGDFPSVFPAIFLSCMLHGLLILSTFI
jgi:hypothetical protein